MKAMKRFQPWSAGLMVAALASAAAPQDAQAEAALRKSYQVASGVCQPFVPTNQVRYNAGGITNAGGSLIYVVCALPGVDATTAETTPEGTLGMRLFASHTSSGTMNLSCTLRPGVITSVTNAQLALPQTKPIDPGQTAVLLWDTDLGWANPNFTCALYPGMTIHYLLHFYQEDIGS